MNTREEFTALLRYDPQETYAAVAKCLNCINPRRMTFVLMPGRDYVTGHCPTCGFIFVMDLDVLAVHPLVCVEDDLELDTL